MKHLLITSLLTSCAITLIACQHNSDSSSPAADPNVVQQDVHPDPVVQGPPLSPSQKQYLAKMFQNQDSFPEDSVFFFDPNTETADAKQARLKEIAAFTPAQKASYDDVEANCQINFTASPADTSGGAATAGHSFTQTSLGTLTGVNCPEQMKQSTSTTLNTISSNLLDYIAGKTTTLSMVYNYHAQTTQDLNILDRALPSNSGTKTAHMDTTSDSKVKYNGSDYESYTESNTSMNGMNINFGKFTAAIQARMYSNKSGLLTQTNMYDKIVITLDAVQATIQIYKKADVIDYYVNGEHMTAQEFQQLFPTFNTTMN